MCLYLKTGQGVCLPVKYINNQMRHLLSFINIYVDFHHLLYSSLLQKETMSSQKMRRSPPRFHGEWQWSFSSWSRWNRQSSSCGRFYVAALTSDWASLVSRTLRACSQPFQGGSSLVGKKGCFLLSSGRTQFLSWSWVIVLRLELMPHIGQVLIFKRKFLVWNITF